MNQERVGFGLLLSGAALIGCVHAAEAQSLVQVTNVRVEASERGLQVVLETATGTIPAALTNRVGNSLLINVNNAQLALPGEETFSALNPVVGIDSVRVSQLNENTIQIAITGETAVPNAEITPTASGFLVSVIPTDIVEELELVVTATRTTEDTQSVPRSVTIIPREQIERQANVTRDVSEILGKLVPGFAPPTQTSSIFGQNLRGRNVAVLIDGVPQGTNRNVQRDLRTIDPSAIERIEVVRGPSALYGDGATGGVINIITRRPSFERLVSRTSVGVNGSLTRLEDSVGTNLQHSISGTEGNLDYVLSASVATTGGFFDAEGDRIPPDPQGQGGLADLNTLNLLGKFGYNFGDQQRLQFTFNHFNEYQASNFATALTRSGRKAEVRPGLNLLTQPATENTILNLDYTHDSLFGSRVRGQLYYRDYFTSFLPFDVRTSPAFGRNVLQSYVESEKIGGRLDIDTPLIGNDTLNLLWGVDYFHENSAQPVNLFDPNLFAASNGLTFVKTGEGFLSPPLEQDSFGLFSQLTWKPTPQLSFNGGVRQEFIGVSLNDFVTLGGNPVSGGNLDYSATLFNLGSVYSVTDNVNVFANFAQGFSIADVARQIRTAPAGSRVTDLRPEAQKVNNYEIGVRGRWQNIQASIAGFYNTSDLGTTFDSQLNILRDPQRIYGIEATVDTQLSEDWQLGGTFTWTEGERDPKRDGSFDTPLANFVIPPVKLTAYVDNQTTPDWRNRFQLLYSGSRDPEGTGFGFNEVESYVTADLISSLRVGSGTVQVSVENVFNNLYFPNISQIYGGISESAARGRRLSLTYQVTW